MEIKIFVGLEQLLKKYDVRVQSVAKIIKVPSIIYMNLESLIKSRSTYFVWLFNVYGMDV